MDSDLDRERPSKPFEPPPGRGETELTVFGRRSVLEALASLSVEVLEVRAEKRAIHGFRREFQEACRSRGVTPEFVSARDVSALSRANMPSAKPQPQVPMGRIGQVPHWQPISVPRRSNCDKLDGARDSHIETGTASIAAHTAAATNTVARPRCVC